MELLYCYLNCISSGKHLTRHLNVIKIMWILLATPAGTKRNGVGAQNARATGGFSQQKRTFYLKTPQKLKVNDHMGGWG